MTTTENQIANTCN